MKNVRVHRPTQDFSYLAAVDAFISEGGFVPPAPRVAARCVRAETVCRSRAEIPLPGQKCSPADLAVMQQHAITFGDGHFHYAGYRYERLSDAAAYALLNGPLRRTVDSSGNAPQARPAALLSETDHRRMAMFAIVREGARFRWGPYRYDRLADAIAYATLMQRRDESVRAQRRQS